MQMDLNTRCRHGQSTKTIFVRISRGNRIMEQIKMSQSHSNADNSRPNDEYELELQPLIVHLESGPTVTRGSTGSTMIAEILFFVFWGNGGQRA